MWPAYEFKVPENKRFRFICHTDAKNEADDQFTIAHLLMTDKVEVRGIIGAHFNISMGRYPEGATAKASVDEINLLLDLMHLQGQYRVFEGAGLPMVDEKTPQDSAGAQFIIEDAMREDDRQLFIGMQGSLTDLASAILMKPEICSRMTCIWIGGGAYPQGGREFNLMQDVNAANVLFSSDMEVWQVPMTSYKQFTTTLAELQLKVKPYGKIGNYLFTQMAEFNTKMAHALPTWPHGESWSLGDEGVISVLLEELEQTDIYEVIPRPLFAPDMTYLPGQGKGTVRVYHKMNARLDLEDLFAKLAINFPGQDD